MRSIQSSCCWRDAQFSYSRLNRIVRQIGAGAGLIVSNEDATHPGPDGYPVAETGALLEALKTCLPGLKYHAVGKPSELIYRAALSRVPATQAELLAIDDNPFTSMLASNRPPFGAGELP